MVHTYNVVAEIHKVLRTYFNGFDSIQYDVAEDFTKVEMDKLISTYYDYLMK